MDSLEIRWPSGTLQVMTGVPAGQVLTVVETGAAAADTPSRDHGLLLDCSPRPALKEARISFRTPGDRPGSLAIFDIGGRLVRSFEVGAGSGLLQWDGTDGAGREVGSGVFQVRLSAQGLTRTERLVRVASR